MSDHPVVTCEKCGLTFPSDWSDEEAETEAVKVFGHPIPKDAASAVCDICYAKLMFGALKADWPKKWIMDEKEVRS